MTTESRPARRPRGASTTTVERYRRPARWLHAGVYLTVLGLLGTGWWLLAGQEGNPSLLSRVAGMADTRLHTWLGWGLTGLLVAALLLGTRALVSFLADSVHFRRADVAWFKGWPRATFTARFAWHDGRYDPGQRVANLALVLLLCVVTFTGIAMALLHGGPAFVWLVPLHRWSTYALTPLLLGHILIASGVLPGYRGVWRSMHLGGRVDATVASRLWPGWSRRSLAERDRTFRHWPN